jgi:hypothetical protein
VLLPGDGQVTGRQILLLWGDTKERQALFKILCATGAQVIFADPNQNSPDIATSCRLLVIDYDSVSDGNTRQLLENVSSAPRRPAVLVLTSSQEKERFIELLSQEALTNIIAKNHAVHASELIVTVQKIMRNDVFGIDKYLTWGIHAHEVTITSSNQKSEIIDQVEKYLDMIGVNRRLIGLAKGVVDEFVMNAVYNAPMDDQGHSKYAHISRTVAVQLQPHEYCTFRYACDGRFLALAITDHFGRLERETVKSYLRKCFIGGADQVDDKEGGAGLGLYCIFESLNQFVINVAPNQRTEMIGIMDISGSYRNFAEHPKSLNIFLQEKLP